MKFVMNKNVKYNGTDYAKGQEISKTDDGFEPMHKAGHIDGAPGKHVEAEEAPEASEPEAKPAQQEKSRSRR